MGNNKKGRLASSRVLKSNWNPDNRQVKVNSNTSDNCNDNLGCRSSGILHGWRRYFSQPPSIFPISCRSASIFKYCLRFILLFSKAKRIKSLANSCFVIAFIINGSRNDFAVKLVSAQRPMKSKTNWSIFCPSVYRSGLGKFWIAPSKYLYIWALFAIIGGSKFIFCI